jgi:hypothetical protein
MTRFEAEKFCARAKLQFGMAPGLIQSFLQNANECKGALSFTSKSSKMTIIIAKPVYFLMCDHN